MNTTTHIRIKSKLRFIVFILLLIFFAVSAINALLGFGSASALSEEKYKTVEVSYGDTIWEIARKYKSKTTDTRKAVYAICAVNDISASDLTPGLTLKIPVSDI